MKITREQAAKWLNVVYAEPLVKYVYITAALKPTIEQVQERALTEHEEMRKEYVDARETLKHNVELLAC